MRTPNLSSRWLPSSPRIRTVLAGGITVNPSGIFHTLNATLNDLIKFAYDMHPKQVVGAPAWADSDKFDIEAKPDKPGCRASIR